MNKPSDFASDTSAVVNFTHQGLDCQLIEHQKEWCGYWCGYVNVPDEVMDRLSGSVEQTNGEDSFSDISVHGGVTYNQKLGSEHWIGFDDAHAIDIRDYYDGLSGRDCVKKETEYLAEQIKKVC